jgi:hypothetical protein
MRFSTAVILAVAVALVGAAVGHEIRPLWPRLLVLPRANPSHYVPAYRRPQGTELLFVYVGKASCAACQHRDLPRLVEAAKRLGRQRAESMSVSFSAVAIGLDLDPFASLAHLNRLGLFDELSVGRGWDNRVALDFFHSRFGAAAATPQFLVLRRNITRDTSYAPARIIVAEELLMRVVGVDRIKAWVERGCSLPLAKNAFLQSSPAAVASLRR